jgi:hypothetical protein
MFGGFIVKDCLWSLIFDGTKTNPPTNNSKNPSLKHKIFKNKIKLISTDLCACFDECEFVTLNIKNPKKIKKTNFDKL